MNLFRSEGHARHWWGYSQAAEAGLLPLRDLMEIFSAPYFRERANGHYVSSLATLRPDFLERLRAVTNEHPFWLPRQS